MKMIKYVSILIALSLCFVHLKAQEKYVILVSLDGFRWDYCSKAETPVLDSIARFGVKAESLQPSFPTKTFPNHYTIVTGLYPDNHGIVNNAFYSPDHKEVYSIGNRKTVEDGSYYSGTPIWNLAESQGIKTASYFWVGSEADIQHNHPSIWKNYQHNFPFEQRVDSIVEWLKLPKNIRPGLLLLYFHQPDSKGHKYGPDSEEVKETITMLDKMIGELFEGLKTLSICEKIDVIITSDHGMGNIYKEKSVNLYDYIDQKWVERIVGANPVFNIWAKEDFVDSVTMALDKVNHLKCWRNENIPERLHYGKNKRTGTHTVLADSSWSINEEMNHYSNSNGAHGYDNENKDMHAIFYAIGPSFKSGFQSQTLKNIDIYPLIAHIVGLKIPVIDGKLERVLQLLKETN